MSFVDPSQDPNKDQDQSQVDAALNPNQQQKNQNQPDSTPPPTSGGGGSGIVSGGGVGGAAASGASSGAPNTPSKSGSWTNLNNYLAANQDQGAAIGNQISDTVNNQGKNAQDEINNLNTGFNQAVASNTTKEDKNAVDQAIQNASNIQAGQNLSQADLDAFKKQATASYSGPTDLTKATGYSQAAQDAAKAKSAAAQSASESGRDVMLQNQFNNASAGGYTQGENNLDQLLLEGSGGASQINQAANQWSNLGSVLNSNVVNSNAAAAAAQAETQKTAQDALSSFNTGRNAANTSAQSYLDAQKSNYSTDYNNLVNLLNGYATNAANGRGTLQLTQQEAALLGLTPREHLYNLYQENSQPGSLVTQAAFDPNAEITANQQAELSALDQLGLAGGQTATNKYTNAALAGTQNADNSIDNSNLQTQIANDAAAFNKYAAATNIVGSGSADPYGSGLPASATEQGTIQNYINGVTPGFSVNANGRQDSVIQQAQAAANAQYWANLQAALKSSGFNNEAIVR